MTLSSPFAVIYPLPSHLASRILNGKKSVFVKYPTHETISPKLASCKKLLFYISSSNKEIAGEADIVSIKLMILSDGVSEYGNRLFLTGDELREYSGGRDNKKMMVFVLGEIAKYPEAKCLGRGITMVGEYMSKEEYDDLVGDLI
ncbi:MAG: DUF365 domain-containing protein [Candidatus Methanoperedens sp.]|nr:DUF365 domain-containing protein [Candidatus Methanoperedens sp.]CAG0982598.1 hypothetical protein METP1_01856 [Methanosarcinales archaeon]